MGFRQADGGLIADQKQLETMLQEMDIHTIQLAKQKGLWAEFSNVAVACAKRVMINAELDEGGDPSHIFDQFDQAEKIEKHSSGRDLNRAGPLIRGAQRQLNAKQYFAALRIACAFRSRKFREKIKERVEVQQDINQRNAKPAPGGA